MIEAKRIKIGPAGPSPVSKQRDTVMSEFKSNDDFFEALRDLVQRIENQGNYAAAEELREGFSCLNGLTDGWAMLMESIVKTISGSHGRIGSKEMSELKDMLTSVKKIVYRR